MRGLRSRVGPEIPIRPTLFDGSTNPAFAYGAVTLFGELFQAASAIQGKALRHHISNPFPDPIRLGLFRFHSPLLPKSQFAFFSSRYHDASPPGVHSPVRLVRALFPEDTRRHPTVGADHGGFPGVRRLTLRTKSHSGIRGSKVACAFPRHIVASHALLRFRSQAIPMSVYAYRTNACRRNPDRRRISARSDDWDPSR